MDEARLYSRTLTDAQLAETFTHKFNDFGLEFYFKFAENVPATTSFDSSNNNKHLSIMGTPMKEKQSPVCLTVQTTCRYGTENASYMKICTSNIIATTAVNTSIAVTGDFSFSFWVKRSTVNLNHFILNIGAAPGINTYLSIGYRSTNQFTVAFYGNDLNTVTLHREIDEWTRK
jgi:hypothetical protein